MRNNLLNPDSAKQNFAFQIIYHVVILVIPLIVSPYLTRTLGSDSLGVYTYTYSIAYYFVIAAMLGINRHGQRIIAQRRSDLLALRKTFWSLYVVHLIASALSILAYVIYLLFVCKSDVNIAMIQTIYVVSAALDITWLFYGLEKFRIVCIRNAIIKVLETACIFLFVHSSGDVGIYTLIMCISICLGQFIMIPQAFAAIPPIRFSRKDMAEHIKPLFTLFAAVIAVTLYTIFDKTLLGILTTMDDVAFYEYADKIIKIPKTLIGVVGTVLFPRACICAAEKKTTELNHIFQNCIIITSMLGFAFCFGLAAVAKTFSVLFYGEAFAICGPVIISMCPLILIIGLGDAIRQCYLYPNKMDSTMVKILFANAGVNIVLSALLITRIGIYGAVIGTIGAEALGLILEIWVGRHYISIKNFFKNIIPYAVIGFVMYLCVRLTAYFWDGTVPALLVQIVVGIVVYAVLTLLYGILFDQTVKELIFSTARSIRNRFLK